MLTPFVFTEEMLESAVDDTAEDFPEVTVDVGSSVTTEVKFVSIYMDWGDQTLVPNIGEDARAEDNIDEFKCRPF